MSRRARAFAVWATLRAYGRSGYRAIVERHLDLGQHLAARVDAAPDLERLADVPLNIVCFRYRPPDVDEGRLDALNQAIGEAAIQDGRVFFGTTVYDGKVAFRPAPVNWRNRPEDVETIVEVVREVGAGSPKERRWGVTTAAAVVALAAVLLGGCGADRATEGSGSLPSPVSDLCGAIRDVNGRRPDAERRAAGATRPDEPRRREGHHPRVPRRRDRGDRPDALGRAGRVPDVTDGGEAARRVSTALGDVRDALAGARDRVEGLSNDDPEAFGSELATIGEDRGSPSRTRPARWSPSRSRLEEAADDVPACDQLAA